MGPSTPFPFQPGRPAWGWPRIIGPRSPASDRFTLLEGLQAGSGRLRDPPTSTRRTTGGAGGGSRLARQTGPPCFEAALASRHPAPGALRAQTVQAMGAHAEYVVGHRRSAGSAPASSAALNACLLAASSPRSEPAFGVGICLGCNHDMQVRDALFNSSSAPTDSPTNSAGAAACPPAPFPAAPSCKGRATRERQTIGWAWQVHCGPTYAASACTRELSWASCCL